MSTTTHDAVTHPIQLTGDGVRGRHESGALVDRAVSAALQRVLGPMDPG